MNSTDYAALAFVVLAVPGAGFVSIAAIYALWNWVNRRASRID